jgi:hypothetical protein
MKSAIFPLSLALSGLASALLVLWTGASLTEGRPGGDEQLPQAGAAVCTAFFVGVQRAGDTHIHLQNVGQRTITARVELVDETGNGLAPQSYSVMPMTAREVVVRRPAFGLGIKVRAGSPELRVRAENVFDDGSEPEPYRVTQCG